MISNSNGNKFKKKITQIQPRNASKTAPLRAETAQPGTRHGSNCLASVRKCTFLTTGTNSAQLIFLRFEKKITFFFNLEKNPFLGKAKSAMSGSALAYVGTRHWGPGGGGRPSKLSAVARRRAGSGFLRPPDQSRTSVSTSRTRFCDFHQPGLQKKAKNAYLWEMLSRYVGKRHPPHCPVVESRKTDHLVGKKNSIELKFPSCAPNFALIRPVSRLFENHTNFTATA